MRTPGRYAWSARESTRRHPLRIGVHMTEASLFRHAPEADVLDQNRSVIDEGPAESERMRTPFDADPADAYDQQQSVPLDDDDYR